MIEELYFTLIFKWYTQLISPKINTYWNHFWQGYLCLNMHIKSSSVLFVVFFILFRFTLFVPISWVGSFSLFFLPFFLFFFFYVFLFMAFFLFWSVSFFTSRFACFLFLFFSLSVTWFRIITVWTATIIRRLWDLFFFLLFASAWFIIVFAVIVVFCRNSNRSVFLLD